ncbi:MAG: ATP-binding protein [Christensenellales bacterium]
MRKRIFAGLLAIALLTGLLYTLLVSGILPSRARARILMELQIQAHTLRRAYPSGGFTPLQLQSLISTSRVTWIGSDGKVLYDSLQQADSLPNHLDRPEVGQALSQGSGSAVRYSDTLREEMVYFAWRLPDGKVLRLSTPNEETRVLLKDLLPWLLGGLPASGLLSYALARLLSRRITRSIDSIDLDAPEEAVTFEELTPMLSRIKQQNLRSAQQLSELTQKQQQMDTLLNSMSEGFIILDSSHRLITINQSAAGMLGGQVPLSPGRSLAEITRRPEILQLLEDLDYVGSATATLAMDNRSVLLSASRVPSAQGAVLLLQDVTSKLEGETMRKRFTANVSHELRTPLTAICGYSEMLVSGMVKKEDEKEFLTRIARESARMLALVEDILKLSKLDEGYPGGQRKKISLHKVAREAVAAFEKAALDKKVSLEMSGGKAEVLGDKTLLGEMVSNLIDNAIKYNREGGKVELSIKEGKSAVTLCVKDTGIGIEPSQQDKIFERFYRTDSSRSKETGGTGLGLSIVKHAAEYHRATLKLESQPGLGTSITVSFPKEGPAR